MIEKHIPGFEGPRPILRRERRSGEELSKICFGWGDPENAPEPDDSDESTGDPSWIVMLPTDGSFKGKVVSQIGLFPGTLLIGDSKIRIGSIGGVATHPDFRNKGLAGCILNYCAQQLCDAGVHLMLISGERGLYTRTGNVKALQFNTFHLSAGKLTLPDGLPTVTVRQFEQGDAAVLARIYQGEAVKFRRQLLNFENSFGPGKLWIIEHSGSKQPLAYFYRMPWYSEPGKLEVVEYAGSRLALAAGFFQILTGVKDPSHDTNFYELTVQVPWQDADLTYLLGWLGAKSNPETLGGHTLRLTNFPALRQDLGSYISAQLSPTLRRGLRFEQSGPMLVDPKIGESGDGKCALVWRENRLELSTTQMTRLVCGSWDERHKPEPDMSNIPAPLEEIIQRLFPLPSFLPGLNLH